MRCHAAGLRRCCPHGGDEGAIDADALPPSTHCRAGRASERSEAIAAVSCLPPARGDALAARLADDRYDETATELNAAATPLTDGARVGEGEWLVIDPDAAWAPLSKGPLGLTGARAVGDGHRVPCSGSVRVPKRSAGRT